MKFFDPSDNKDPRLIGGPGRHCDPSSSTASPTNGIEISPNETSAPPQSRMVGVERIGKRSSFAAGGERAGSPSTAAFVRCYDSITRRR